MSFIDEILELDDEHALAKYVWREKDCEGHFPGNPVVPGVKMIEMAAQTAAALELFRQKSKAIRNLSLIAVEKASFKKSVRPGEAVVGRASLVEGNSSANERFCAEVELQFQGGEKDGETIMAGRIALASLSPQSEKNR